MLRAWSAAEYCYKDEILPRHMRPWYILNILKHFVTVREFPQMFVLSYTKETIVNYPPPPPPPPPPPHPTPTPYTPTPTPTHITHPTPTPTPPPTPTPHPPPHLCSEAIWEGASLHRGPIMKTNFWWGSTIMKSPQFSLAAPVSLLTVSPPVSCVGKWAVCLSVYQAPVFIYQWLAQTSDSIV